MVCEGKLINGMRFDNTTPRIVDDPSNFELKFY